MGVCESIYRGGYFRLQHKAKGQIEQLHAQKAAWAEKADILGAFMFELREWDGVITGFVDRRWIWMVEKLTVLSDGRLVFTFFNGQEITA